MSSQSPQLSFILDETPEAMSLRRDYRAKVLDLSKELLPAPDSDLVQRARLGRDVKTKTQPKSNDGRVVEPISTGTSDYESLSSKKDDAPPVQGDILEPEVKVLPPIPRTSLQQDLREPSTKRSRPTPRDSRKGPEPITKIAD
jgi:hypothetical protein